MWGLAFNVDEGRRYGLIDLHSPLLPRLDEDAGTARMVPVVDGGDESGNQWRRRGGLR